MYEIIDDAEEFEIEDDEDDSTITFDGHKSMYFSYIVFNHVNTNEICNGDMISIFI